MRIPPSHTSTPVTATSAQPAARIRAPRPAAPTGVPARARDPLDAWVEAELANVPKVSPFWRLLPRGLGPQTKPCGAALAAERVRQARARGDEHLDLSDLGLRSWPPGLSQLPLHELHARGNYLTSLEGLPKSLVLLDVSDNALSTFAGLPATVEYLFASENPLASFEALRNSPGLRSLLLASCGLTTLMDLPAMGSLTRLYVSRNHLTSLAGIERYPRLESLNAAHNAIAVVPDLSATTDLQSLVLSDNRLASIDALGPLPQAIILDVRKNPLQSLAALRPEDYRRLSFLRVDKRVASTVPAGLQQRIDRDFRAAL